MTKAELVSAIAQKTEFTKKDSEKFLVQISENKLKNFPYCATLVMSQR